MKPAEESRLVVEHQRFALNANAASLENSQHLIRHFAAVDFLKEPFLLNIFEKENKMHAVVL